MNNIFFNAHHSPIGAFASFTLGFPGAKGGLGLELGRPADQNVHIGLETRSGNSYEVLPFAQLLDDERRRFDLEAVGVGGVSESVVTAFPSETITRAFSVATDTWQAGDLAFRILSPARAVPDPSKKSVDDTELRMALVPAVFVEITVDNRASTRARRAFFGYEGADPYSAMRRLDTTTNDTIVGIGQGRNTAIIACDKGVVSAQGFNLPHILLAEQTENWGMGIGGCGVLLMTVPAGEVKTYRFAVCFHRAGLVTTGIDASYYYTRFFPTLESVASFARDHINLLIAACERDDTLICNATLTSDQAFMLAHSIHSYYGSTQLLDDGTKPLWVVNEGEYRMMNTFDLVVDQLFYELRMHPWTIRNVLDQFVDRYSYTDTVRLPNDPTDYPGGIGFTHDMGVANSFSRPGYSAYEQVGLHGCFSYMTHEQLVNFVCCATAYVAQTNDTVWLEQNLAILEACFQSMCNRDHVQPEQRDGIMDADSSRTCGGSEITTYDSLDTSLGQARRNAYLASKCWAAYLALEHVFTQQQRADLAVVAGTQAERIVAAMSEHIGVDGSIPAVLDGQHPSRIIPAIEGLVFPLFTGCPEALQATGRFGSFLEVLKQHLTTVLVPGTCIFPDGGWKLSSSSNNSWLSKIYLCQFIAREILGTPWDESGARADEAHVAWLTNPEYSYWSWSDQIISGVITGSKYYPRGVTSILWLYEGQNTAAMS